MKSANQLLVLVVLGMMFATGVQAAEEAVQAPPMDPAMAEKMEQMKKFMMPTEAHKVLEQFVGKWTYSGELRMTPEAPAEAMTGNQENTLVYGGRFLKQEIEGPWMGENFEGLGFTGFDNVKGEYVSVWLDSIGTGIMTMAGQYDAAEKILMQSGVNSCPMTGEKDRPGRSEWKVVDADHNTYTSYSNGPDGQEFKAMEINYARVA